MDLPDPEEWDEYSLRAELAIEDRFGLEEAPRYDPEFEAPDLPGEWETVELRSTWSLNTLSANLASRFGDYLTGLRLIVRSTNDDFDPELIDHVTDIKLVRIALASRFWRVPDLRLIGRVVGLEEWFDCDRWVLPIAIGDPMPLDFSLCVAAVIDRSVVGRLRFEIEYERRSGIPKPVGFGHWEMNQPHRIKDFYGRLITRHLRWKFTQQNTSIGIIEFSSIDPEAVIERVYLKIATVEYAPNRRSRITKRRVPLIHFPIHYDHRRFEVVSFDPSIRDLSSFRRFLAKPASFPRSIPPEESWRVKVVFDRPIERSVVDLRFLRWEVKSKP